ncbi:trafficking protein Mon1-domain-containing protein [Crucibulum laeve]|uniref:Vacuolar fusion protein MON1 n=1 Tax=Crucibulum laeve TaxID=68775 RepID=A0A5C3M7L8_9AGAR|nr:trafficking protein Mon1-domain-containing protein [Crucibulum laeve]
MDADITEGEEVTVAGRIDAPAGDEGPKKLLRDQLRKTLSHRHTSHLLAGNSVSRSRNKGKDPETDDITFIAVHIVTESRYPPRQYFVLTDAGKPVFISRAETREQDNITATIGIMQALISIFIDDNDKLRCINAGRTRITFLLRSPLYYACVSSWGEPESVTRSHLEYLHLQILSIVTAAQLRRIFERRTNFDLRRLLNGAETFLTSLLERLEVDLAMSTSSLNCLKIDPNLRKRIAEIMVPPSKMKDILYVVLIAQDRVVTLIRPKKHSIHPADIHILLNTIHSPSIYNSPASASWIPICLPKFNPTGFVNGYISFLRTDDTANMQNHSSPRSTTSQPLDDEQAVSTPTITRSSPSQVVELNDLGISMVCISGGGDFEVIKTWCDAATKKLTDDGALNALVNAFQTGQTEYSASELGIPGLRHFIYKSRAQVQITLPIFEEPYDNIADRRRLTTMYQTLHDAIHAKSGQEGTLKLQYIRTDTESVMGWITQPFELYITLSPRLPKSAAVGAANAVARWVKKEETRLFLRDAPVF